MDILVNLYGDSAKLYGIVNLSVMPTWRSPAPSNSVLHSRSAPSWASWHLRILGRSDASERRGQQEQKFKVTPTTAHQP